MYLSSCKFSFFFQTILINFTLKFSTKFNVVKIAQARPSVLITDRQLLPLANPLDFFIGSLNMYITNEI